MANPKTGMNIRLKVKDLDCMDCARALETVARKIDGVEDASVSVTMSTIELRLGEGLDPKSVIRSLRRKGYEASPVDLRPSMGVKALRGAVSRRRLFLTTVCAGFLLAALLTWLLKAPERVTNTMLIAATVAGLPLTLTRAIHAVRSLFIDMNVLMSIAIVAAAALGEWQEAAVVALLFSVAIILEAMAMARTRSAIESLMELSPDTATVKRDGQRIKIEASQISPGEVIVVRPGERIPLEGTVISGATSVDESPITGEAMPVEKEAGSEVFAGTLNEDGLIEVAVTKPKEESTLARIIHLIEHVEERKAPVERFVDRFARIYTPVVVAGALLVATVPYALGLSGDWIYRSLVLLIIACPCALVIATPVAIVSGLTSAAKRGILIKGGAHLEEAARVSAIALDKTGTLTTGTPAVARVRPLGGMSENQLLQIAAGVESASTHPLAGAVMAEARRRGIHFAEARDVTSLTGSGVSAEVEGTRYYAAKPEFFIERSETARIALGQLSARTAIGVGTESELLGFIEFVDQVRPGARRTLERLKSLGIKRTIMITGDREEAAKEIASEAGVDEYHSNLLPDDKVRLIERLKSDFDKVAMVGDGVNDAPALASSHVGVAMAAAGSDTAIDTADAALMSDDIRKLIPLFRISKRVRRTVQANIALAISIKAVFLVLATLGSATMWMAVFADMGASLIVIANGLRLLSVDSERTRDI